MKEKHKRLIMQKFPWYDYSYFIELMELWLRESAYKHENQGYCVSSGKTAKQLRIAAHLCKRIREDDYSNPFWFGEVSIHSSLDITRPSQKVCWSHKPNKKVFRLCQQRQLKQRQKDIKMLTELINKQILGWWD